MKAGTVRGGVSLSHDPLRFSLTFPVIILLPFRNQNSLIFISKVVAIAPPLLSLLVSPTFLFFSFFFFFQMGSYRVVHLQHQTLLYTS